MTITEKKTENQPELPESLIAPKETKTLSKTDILNINDLETKSIFVKAWNGNVILRSMTGTERDHFEGEIMDIRDNDKIKAKERYLNLRAKFLQKIIVDDNGDNVFTSTDIVELGKKNAKVLNMLWLEARKLSGLDEDDLEELEKN